MFTPPKEHHRPSPEIPLSFASPPPSSPLVPFSPCDRQATPTNAWNAGSAQKVFPARLLDLAPDPFMSPDHRHQQQSPQVLYNRSSATKRPDSGKRGRPRADVISNLMMEGSSSPSEIKCEVCHRVFPREKSLQAHLRTHTGEKPYVCDYPGCTRAFTQSGQLKTHQRLHAGEKPFVCSAPGCTNRYTHANRTCPNHPYHKPQRTNNLILQPVISNGENAEAVRKWLENYKRERLDKTPGKPNSNVATNVIIATPPPKVKNDPLSPSTTIPLSATPNENLINILGPATSNSSSISSPLPHGETSTMTSNRKPKSKRGLVTELEQENVPQDYCKPQSWHQSGVIYVKQENQEKPEGCSAVDQKVSLPRVELPKIPLSPIRQNLQSHQRHWMLSPSRQQLFRSQNIYSEERLNLSPKRMTTVSSPRRKVPISPKRLLLSPKRSPNSSRAIKFPLSPKRLLLSPRRRSIQSRSPTKPHVPKKRWLKEVLFKEQQQQDDTENEVKLNPSPSTSQSSSSPSTSSSQQQVEVLARPISWNDEEYVRRRSPKSWMVARTLVELHDKLEQSQPLNLSLSSGVKS